MIALALIRHSIKSVTLVSRTRRTHIYIYTKGRVYCLTGLCAPLSIDSTLSDTVIAITYIICSLPNHQHIAPSYINPSYTFGFFFLCRFPNANVRAIAHSERGKLVKPVWVSSSTSHPLFPASSSSSSSRTTSFVVLYVHHMSGCLCLCVCVRFLLLC